MIQARKLGHVVLKVRDAQKSKEFYIRALGLKVANAA
jgi:catechol 2,3-dioxygenase-like lactoylglutathione lyase family enzyme